MAKSKEENEQEKKIKENSEENSVSESSISEDDILNLKKKDLKEEKNADSFSKEDILKILTEMQQKVATLEEEKKELENKVFYAGLDSKRATNASENITVIWNCPGRLEIDLPNLSLVMTKIGEERQITLSELQTLVGRYRKFFEKELLVLGPQNMDLASKYQVSVYDDSSNSFIHSQDLNKLGDMTIYELEEYYKKLSHNSKNGFLSYWLYKCYELEPDTRFYDAGKLEYLNRISSSHTFDTLLKEIERKEKFKNK